MTFVACTMSFVWILEDCEHWWAMRKCFHLELVGFNMTCPVRWEMKFIIQVSVFPVMTGTVFTARSHFLSTKCNTRFSLGSVTWTFSFSQFAPTWNKKGGLKDRLYHELFKPMHKCPTSDWCCLYLMDVSRCLWRRQIKGLMLKKKKKKEGTEWGFVIWFWITSNSKGKTERALHYDMG